MWLQLLRLVTRSHAQLPVRDRRGQAAEFRGAFRADPRGNQKGAPATVVFCKGVKTKRRDMGATRPERYRGIAAVIGDRGPGQREVCRLRFPSSFCCGCHVRRSSGLQPIHCHACHPLGQTEPISVPTRQTCPTTGALQPEQLSLNCRWTARCHYIAVPEFSASCVAGCARRGGADLVADRNLGDSLSAGAAAWRGFPAE